METATFLNRRKNQRIESKSGIAITPNGLCTLVNLSHEGVSFKCVDGADTPTEWSMAIYDVSGKCIEKLKVKRIWEKRFDSPGTASLFSVEVGGVFKRLSASQKAKINTYLLEITI